MIPPSYLFKSVYRHAWQDQPAPVTPQRPNFYKGLLTPMLRSLSAALHRRRAPHDNRFTKPACD